MFAWAKTIFYFEEFVTLVKRLTVSTKLKRRLKTSKKFSMVLQIVFPHHQVYYASWIGL